MQTFFVGRDQKTWSSWCHDWVHQLLKDPKQKPQQQQHYDLKAERQRWYTFLAVDLTSETGFILKSSSTGVSAPRKRIHTVYMHPCWLKVETWWHGWKQLPLSPVSIELVMQLQGKWLTCLPRNHIPGCHRCQQGCGSSAKSRFNTLQLWFKQDLRPIAKPKLLMVHDDSIPLSGVSISICPYFETDGDRPRCTNGIDWHSTPDLGRWGGPRKWWDIDLRQCVASGRTGEGSTLITLLQRALLSVAVEG